MAAEWPKEVGEPEPNNWLPDAFYRLLAYAEGAEWAERAGLVETPRRAAHAWEELMCGYRAKLDLKTFDAEGHDEIIVMRDVPFHSVCEHHLLPFHGRVDFAYLPNHRLLGLSKFARLTDYYSRRLQTQERLTSQLAEALCKLPVVARGVAVIVRAEHTCMSMRGVQRPGHTTVTSVMRGAFKDNPESRAEALALLGGTNG